MGVAWRLGEGKDGKATKVSRVREEAVPVANGCRLKREDCRRTKHDCAFSKWEVPFLQRHFFTSPRSFSLSGISVFLEAYLNRPRLFDHAIGRPARVYRRRSIHGWRPTVICRIRLFFFRQPDELWVKLAIIHRIEEFISMAYLYKHFATGILGN